VPNLDEIKNQIRDKGFVLPNSTKDEFDHMTNWQQRFEQIWMQTRWLRSYAEINELALKKILKKFVKNFFLIKDNTLNKRLTQIIEQKQFKRLANHKSSRDIKILCDSIITFYGDIFTNSNRLKAKQKLNAQNNKIRTKDAGIMFFLAGAIAVALLFWVFFLVYPEQSHRVNPWDLLLSGEDTYIFTWVIVFILLSCSVCIQVFRAYNVNYSFIFEIDPKHKIIHHQMYRVTMLFFFIWLMCFVWQTAKIKLSLFDNTYATFTLILLLSFILLCVSPFNCVYRSARTQLLITMGHILVSPFGLVRFRHFFFADVLTSITKPLQETMIIYCYFAGPQKDWKYSEEVNLKQECIGAQKIYTLLAFLPYWFRFAQCLNKYHDTKNGWHLVNAGKYFSDLMVPFTQLWYHNYEYNTAFWIYFGTHFFASFYSYLWDIYMDWGLMRCFKPGKYGLREEMNYGRWFYYYAMVSDFILRFVWIITLFQLGNPNSVFNTFQIMNFIMIFLECFRRAQWSLIRVENEQNNNFETYRTIPIIPPIVDQDV
jgi:hypothetical protein